MKFEKLKFLFLLSFFLYLTILSVGRNYIWIYDISLLKDIIKGSPFKAKGHSHLGVLQYKMGFRDEGIKSLDESISLDNTYPVPYYNLGLIYMFEGRDIIARDYFMKALKVFPDYAEAYNNLGVIHLNNKEYFESLVMFKKSIELKPTYLAALKNLGVVHFQEENYSGAIEQFKSTIKLYDKEPSLYNTLALIYLKAGDVENSEINFKIAKSLE